jgi:nucleotide-binding universal stress UspA family protein
MKTRAPKYKILLATDYSDAMMNAERYAVQFAKQTNSTLTLLYVYESPIPFPVRTTIFLEEMKDNEKSQLKRLTERRNKLFNSLKIKSDELICNCVVSEGNIGEQILKEALEAVADFIFVGTHGASGFLETMFGSHSWHVIEKARIPIIAIPRDSLFTEIKNIVFATEYREGEIPVISFITDFAKYFDAEVTVLHVTNYVLSKKYQTQVFEKFRDDINGKISYSKLKMRLIKNKNIAEGINIYCSENKVDLLVMSPEKLSLFEKIFFPRSITKKMSFITNIPLMAVPDFFNPKFSERLKKMMQRGNFVKKSFE